MPYAIRPLKVRFLHYRNYTYIIVDEASRQAAIVDPAWEFERIASVIEGLNITLTTILLTHSHFDHVNAVGPLLKRYNAQVYISAEEKEFYGFRCERLNSVQHSDIIEIGHTRISCILTPGHTAGGMCYLLSDALFTGDTIFSEGCGICNQPGGDPEKMFESVQMIKTTINPDVCIYPGHSFGLEPGQPLGSLMKENIYLQIDQKDLFVNWRMRKNFFGGFNFQ
jgi:glyoxylase-like metal-dependent hydrolase (beta-lactamase superfamily II)